MENEKRYFLGLDIGTNSVGWCVTDRDYNIVRKHTKRNGKTVSLHLWGSRLFDEAETAAGRRGNRNTRRRLVRRRARVVMLQEIFAPEMNKVDKDFFDRLNNSAFRKEDNPFSNQYDCLLFNDKDYTDKEYYAKYPTIYHLRKAIMEHPEKRFDIREIYLAIVHMIKYRGNFLTEGEMSNIGNNTTDLKKLFNELDSLLLALNEETEEDENADTYSVFSLNEEHAQCLLDLFKKESGKSLLFEKEREILNLEKSNKDIRLSLLKLINGSSMKLVDLFKDLKGDENEEVEKTKLDFTSDDFIDNTFVRLPEMIGDNKAGLIEAAKNLYDFRVLANVLKGNQYISDAMVDRYETHQKQLKQLKELIKLYSPKQYKSFFRDVFEKGKNTPLKNYANYVGYSSTGAKKIKVAHSTSKDELYKEIKKLLPIDKVDDGNFEWKRAGDCEIFIAIKRAMDDGNYLPRQNGRENGVFPYQLNKLELKKIIDNQKQYYPFLAETAPDFNNPKKESYKLISLLEYKIPYYVGPLSGDKAWLKKTGFGENNKITPWNFNQAIDKEATEQAFIEGLKNSCTYIIGEPTLPSNSLLYSEYVFLNEVNNWKINNQDISKSDKEYLFLNVYLKGKPSIKRIKEAFNQKYNTTVELTTRTGKELKAEDIHADLKSYRDMMKVFGNEFYKDENLVKLAEEIIFDITILEDKKLLQERFEKMNLNKEQLKALSTLKYSGWGKLSRLFLDGIKTELDTYTGEVLDHTIIDLMREYPLNLMEIYEADERFSFKKQVEERLKDSNVDINTIIDEEYVSPSMKRSLRQTLKVVDELKKILKIDSFDSYFVECTRENDPDKKNQRKDSRKKQIQDLYKEAKDIDQKLKDQLEGKSDDELRGKKLFLYFMQMGRSVYTGKEIDIDSLETEYDIDHIIPQAKVKDDSLINTVLVEKTVNTLKSDSYPIPDSCLTKQGREWIAVLSKNKLLSDEKKARLLRNYPLTEDEEASFVNRQLTMTNQAVKAVCDILKKTDKGANIVYSKAGLVSDFRKAFDLVKCRDINDFHHANDAFLNIVVGNVYNKVFTNKFTAEKVRRSKQYSEGLNLKADKFFATDKCVYGKDTKIWRAKETPELIRKQLAFNDPLVTHMLVTQTGKQGFFNKISISPASEGAATMPLKNKAPFNQPGFEKKYGGYNNLTCPYFILVESDDKKGKKYTLEFIPAVYIANIHSKEDMVQYFMNHNDEYKLKNPKVILEKVLIHSIVEFNTFVDGKKQSCRVGINGRTGNSIFAINDNQLHLKDDVKMYIHKISKALGKNGSFNKINDIKNINLNQLFNKDENYAAFDLLCQKAVSYPYKLLPELSGVLDKMSCQETRSLFIQLSLEEQLNVLYDFICLLGCKTIKINLSKLNLTSQAGGIRFNKQLKAGVKIITKSITGFYETVLFETPN